MQRAMATSRDKRKSLVTANSSIDTLEDANDSVLAGQCCAGRDCFHAIAQGHRGAVKRLIITDESYEVCGHDSEGMRRISYWLFSGGNDGSIRKYHINSSQCVLSKSLSQHQVIQMDIKKILQETLIFVLFSDGYLCSITTDGKSKQNLGRSRDVTSFSVSSRTGTLYIGTSIGSIMGVDVDSNTPLQSFQLPSGIVSLLSLEIYSKNVMIVGNQDSIVRYVNLDNGRIIATNPTSGTPFAIRITSSRRIVIGSDNGYILISNMDNYGIMLCIAYSPIPTSDTRILCGETSSGRLYELDLESGLVSRILRSDLTPVQINSYEVHRQAIHDIQFVESSYIWTASQDGSIRLINDCTKQTVMTLASSTVQFYRGLLSLLLIVFFYIIAPLQNLTPGAQSVFSFFEYFCLSTPKSRTILLIALLTMMILFVVLISFNVSGLIKGKHPPSFRTRYVDLALAALSSFYWLCSIILYIPFSIEYSHLYLCFSSKGVPSRYQFSIPCNTPSFILIFCACTVVFLFYIVLAIRLRRVDGLIDNISNVSCFTGWLKDWDKDQIAMTSDFFLKQSLVCNTVDSIIIIIICLLEFVIYSCPKANMITFFLIFASTISNILYPAYANQHLNQLSFGLRGSITWLCFCSTLSVIEYSAFADFLSDSQSMKAPNAASRIEFPLYSFIFLLFPSFTIGNLLTVKREGKSSFRHRVSLGPQLRSSENYCISERNSTYPADVSRSSRNNGLKESITEDSGGTGHVRDSIPTLRLSYTNSKNDSDNRITGQINSNSRNMSCSQMDVASSVSLVLGDGRRSIMNTGIISLNDKKRLGSASALHSAGSARDVYSRNSLPSAQGPVDHIQRPSALIPRRSQQILVVQSSERLTSSQTHLSAVAESDTIDHRTSFQPLAQDTYSSITGYPQNISPNARDKQMSDSCDSGVSRRLRGSHTRNKSVETMIMTPEDPPITPIILYSTSNHQSISTFPFSSPHTVVTVQAPREFASDSVPVMSDFRLDGSPIPVAPESILKTITPSVAIDSTQSLAVIDGVPAYSAGDEFQLSNASDPSPSASKASRSKSKSRLAAQRKGKKAKKPKLKPGVEFAGEPESEKSGGEAGAESGREVDFVSGGESSVPAAEVSEAPVPESLPATADPPPTLSSADALSAVDTTKSSTAEEPRIVETIVPESALPANEPSKPFSSKKKKPVAKKRKKKQKAAPAFNSRASEQTLVLRPCEALRLEEGLMRQSAPELAPYAFLLTHASSAENGDSTTSASAVIDIEHIIHSMPHDDSLSETEAVYEAVGSDLRSEGLPAAEDSTVPQIDLPSESKIPTPLIIPALSSIALDPMVNAPQTPTDGEGSESKAGLKKKKKETTKKRKSTSTTRKKALKQKAVKAEEAPETSVPAFE